MKPRTARLMIAAIIVLQVLVLVSLPLAAGPRMPSGTIVHLLATEPDEPDAIAKGGMPPEEVALDFGFSTLDVPRGAEQGDRIYVQLRGARTSSRPLTLGKVVRDPADLPDDATWIALMVGEHDAIDSGPLTVYFDPDAAHRSALRTHLADDGLVDVEIALDNDGDAEIRDIRIAR